MLERICAATTCVLTAATPIDVSSHSLFLHCQPYGRWSFISSYVMVDIWQCCCWHICKQSYSSSCQCRCIFKLGRVVFLPACQYKYTSSWFSTVPKTMASPGKVKLTGATVRLTVEAAHTGDGRHRSVYDANRSDICNNLCSAAFTSHDVEPKWLREDGWRMPG